MTDKFQNKIKNLIEEFNFKGQKKFKLIVLFGLLGDFDSFEYAINLKSFIDKNQDKNLDIFAIAIGNQNGKEKFCKFLRLPASHLPQNKLLVRTWCATKQIPINIGNISDCLSSTSS